MALAPAASFVYLAPEVRAGVRLGRGFEISVGVELWALFAIARPTWDGARPINAAADGSGTFAGESLVSPVLLAVAPGVGARYEF